MFGMNFSGLCPLTRFWYAEATCFNLAALMLCFIFQIQIGFFTFRRIINYSSKKIVGGPFVAYKSSRPALHITASECIPLFSYMFIRYYSEYITIPRFMNGPSYEGCPYGAYSTNGFLSTNHWPSISSLISRLPAPQNEDLNTPRKAVSFIGLDAF